MAKRADTTQVTRIAVKVAAGAATTAISGWHDQCLRIRLSTAPERGKANATLVALLASALGLSKSAITIVRGQHSAHKTIEVTGLSREDIMARLQPNSSNR
jgi:uncharacterized protein (TIGR00251 family)